MNRDCTTNRYICNYSSSLLVKGKLFNLLGPKVLFLVIAILTSMNMCFTERKSFVMCFTECGFDLKRGSILHLETTLPVNIKYIGP